MTFSYQDALKYLYENLPMFQRIGPAAIKKDLTNTLKLCKALGDPHRAFKSIHVAGTNGKGSTCHMLASILQASNYKTGLYTSPHLKEFTERIRINGHEVSKQYVADFVNRMRSLIEEIRPSFFEITVAMAFDYFAREKVDVAIVEVGLGGRLDSTNVITPLVSVITNISLDHTELLGKTLPEIAREKAGIIKSGVPVVISERQAEVEDVFVKKATKENAHISFASDSYSVSAKSAATIDVIKDGQRMLQHVKFPLQGFYQQRNIPGVMKTVELLQQYFRVTPEQLKTGMEGVLENTALKGRWQRIASNPTVICDTAHNFSGVQQVLLQLASEQHKRLFIIWGMVKDKDPGPVMGLLPNDAFYYFCQAKIPRALDAEMLRTEALRFGLAGEVIRDVNQALIAARTQATAEDLIYVGGSTYVVAEIDDL
jgi:dihydrofolate synthase/folylpolyglutamate synthase